jgi:DNA-binding beta-propeller fold protein YncE
MNTITAIPLHPIDQKKFNRLLVVVTIIMLLGFGTFYMLNMTPPGTGSVAPGRLGAPVFSHYIYGGFGNDSLHKPMYATFGNNRVYVSDTNNHRVQVFEENGTPLFMFGERGELDGQFFYPYGIVVGPDSNVYVADMYRSVIQIFSPEGEFLRYFGEGPMELGVVAGPGMMFLDKDNRLLVANVDSKQVVIFDIQTEKVLQTVCVDGDVLAPNGVTMDENGYIYVVDTGGQRVVVYSPDGSRPVRIINGSEDGRGQSPLMNPRGISVRGDWVYVVSNLTHSIHVFDKSGKEVFSFGKQGDKQGEFMYPNGMFMDSRGRMLITDSIGGRVAVYR